MDDLNVIKKLAALFKPYMKSISIILFCLVASTIINLLIPLTSKRIIDDGFLKNSRSVVVLYAIIAFSLLCLDKLLTIFKEKKRAEISAKITFSLFEEAYIHITKIKIEYFGNTNYAQILNNISTDIGNIARIADNSLFFVITQVFGIIGGIIGLVLIDPEMTAIVLLFLPAKYFIVKHFARTREKLMNEYIQVSSDFAQWFGDTVGGIKEIRLFGLLAKKHLEFIRKQHRVLTVEKRMSVLDAYNTAFESVLLQFSVMLLYIIGANMVFTLQLTIGSIFAFLTYSTYVTNPLSAILNIGYMLSGIIPSANRYYKFLALESEPTALRPNANLLPADNVVDSLQFDNVSFSYIDGKPVLHNISFTIATREKVALIGMNGSGKSTIIDLILRFYQPDSGTILLDGVGIETLPINEYRNYLSVVSQQVYLFDASIRENISLYTSVNEAAYAQVFEDSQLSEFILASPPNLNVGQNGALLSGGQRQKIALARALLHNKPILIFDEATSNLDVQSEMNINKLLEHRLKNKTVLIVTHKLEILKHVDKIIFLENGTINQIGTHKELMLYSDSYRKMLEIFENQ